MARAHVQEVSPEQILFAPIANTHLRNGDKILIFADVVRETFIAERIDFARDNKAVGPNFY